ncbi:hypothetical protein MFIFM68171_11333 [Madurella fahalii]|uniref:Nephrocystin 3-like N-terminal domain-containing protein n=1 Tax=Madurella fahalii TaxID=1157608 RepID=A0ABQ0GTQ3_9PEZI
MYGRFDMVDEAHFKTFRWILHEDDVERHVGDASYKLSNGSSEVDEDTASKQQDEMKHAAREKFTTWLSSGEGVFHISGKLGSGKSTLMKYLGDHPRTQAKLREWAGSRDLVVAKFFFWRPGSPKQKSLDGLYRSLLHDVLKSRPELISEVLPELWKDARAAPWQVQTEFLISEKDVRNAFTRLVRTTSLSKHCFCFFIDGLDEYQETAQKDHKEMVKLLTSWTTTAP